MATAETEKAHDTKPEFAMQDFQSLPSKSTLERIADLPVFDVDGKTVPFKSLYWSNDGGSKKVMIIFIRHFFCGSCQDYLQTLATAIPPPSLPADTSIRIVGCGSHTLIPSYIKETKCPYPIFADPSQKLYSLLGMTRSLSLGNKNPAYIRHPLVTAIVKGIAQVLKRIGSGDFLQGGDIKQVGGEFLFEVEGGDSRLAESTSGEGVLAGMKVTWCHRMENTRDHTEIADLKMVLGMEEVDTREEARRRSGSN